jgi:4-amino-4-deoxy-L-arabinose transferase-like glycosyltransferase
MDTLELPERSSSVPGAPRLTVADALALGLSIALGAALRLYGLDAWPLWLDEASTADYAGRGLPDCLFAEIHHPPLYYLLVHLSIRAFGSSDAALRLPSVILGVSTIPVVWALARRLAPSQPGAARLAAALTAASPFLVALSQEARSYSLFLLLAGTASLVFMRFSRLAPVGAGGPWLALHAALSACLLYTHYFGAWVLFAHELVYWRHGRARPRAWLAARGVTFVAFLPWVLWVVHRLGGGAALEARQWIGPAWLRIPYAAVAYLLGYGVAAANTSRLGDSAWSLVREEAPVVLPSLALLGWLCVRGVRRMLTEDRREVRTWLLAVFAVPVATLAALSFRMNLLHERYTSFQVLFLLIALGRGLVSLEGWRRLLAAGGTVAVLAFCLYAYHAAPGRVLWYELQYGKEDWRGAARFVAENEPDAVLLAPAYLRLAFDRYFRGTGDVTRLVVPEGSTSLPDLGTARRLALVLSHDGAAEEALRAALDRRARLIAAATFPQGCAVRVFIYQIGAPGP